MKYFDYLYYRVFSAYQKWGETTPWIYASILVALLQFLNLLFLYLILDELINILFNSKPVIVVLLLTIIGLNFHRYHNAFNYDLLKDVWKDELKETKKKKGWMVVLYIIFSVLLPIAYAFIKYNLYGG